MVKSLASHISSNGRSQFGAIKIGASDCIDSKVACVTHKLKGQILVGGNQDWSFSQFSFKCLKGFNTLFGEKEWGIFLKKTGHRPVPGAWKLLGLSGEGSGSRGEVVELGWNGGSWWESGGREI
nr:hypothetical protein [Tanacetum cinerariifolium]